MDVGQHVKTSDMIKELCNKKNISISELARRIGQTPQYFGKKLKRDTVSLEEMKQIRMCWKLYLSNLLFCLMVNR